MSACLFAEVGKPQGQHLAIALALSAGVPHALLNALRKGRDDPWLALAAIDARDGIIAAPFNVFRALLRRGVFGTFGALFSFSSVMLATRLDRVRLVVALREASTVFAALIGWYVLGEKVGPWRGALMVLTALGAVVMEGAA